MHVHTHAYTYTHLPPGMSNRIWSYYWTRNGVCTINVCLQCTCTCTYTILSHILDAVLHWFLVHHCLQSSPSRPSQLQLEPAKLREVECTSHMYMYSYCSGCMTTLLHAGRPSKSNSSSLNQPLTFKSKVKSSGYTQAPRYNLQKFKLHEYGVIFLVQNKNVLSKDKPPESNQQPKKQTNQ